MATFSLAGPRTSVFLRYSLSALVFLLAACTSAPPSTVVPDLSFANISPVRVSADSVQVIDNYKSAMKLPNVEYLFKQPPEQAAHQLAAEKIMASGGATGRVLRVYIDDAAVVANVLTPDDGILSVFTPGPDVRYHARVALRFELVDKAAPDMILGHASVVADRDLTLAHGTSPSERDMAFFGMNEKLMKDLGDSFQTIVKGTFGQP